MVSAIDSLPEERRDDLTARRTRMKRGAFPAPIRPDGTVPGQHLLNHGEESLSDGDEALGVRPVVVLGEADLGLRLNQVCGYKGSCVAHRFASSLSLPIAARSK